MKKNLLTLGVILMAALSFTSCSDDDDDSVTIDFGTYSHGIYVACAGNWGQNNGTVGAVDYNPITSSYTFTDLYTNKNGKGVGDAQDIIFMNGHLVVASTTSSKIEILDGNGKVEKSIPMPNTEPRYLATDGKYVYCSAYNGYIYKIDFTSSTPIVGRTMVGGHPEALSVAGGKLYVNMSDYEYNYTGKSIAVVDLETFRKTKDIEVAPNPYNQSIAVGNAVYFVSTFHYEDALVQKIDATTDKVTEVCHASAIAYDAKSNSLVCLYAPYNSKEKRFFTHNLTTGEEKNFDISATKSPQQVNVDANGTIYVIDNPSYKAPSELFVYDNTGKLLQGNLLLGYSAQNLRFIR